MALASWTVHVDLEAEGMQLERIDGTLEWLS